MRDVLALGRKAASHRGVFALTKTLRYFLVWTGLGMILGFSGCVSVPSTSEETSSVVVTPTPSEASIPVSIETVPARRETAPGQPVPRFEDEILVAGQRFRTGTKVVLWTDAGGFDGYRVERRFGDLNRSGWEEMKQDGISFNSPNRFGMRAAVLTSAEQNRVRGGGWDLATLQRVVDQFVLHYDASGTSAQCFKRLHDDRGLSIHFLLDVDGTLYQTLDLKERAWHATVANSRSIGIEIANIGAYPSATAEPLRTWYKKDAEGHPRLHIPKGAELGALDLKKVSGRPVRPELVKGKINGSEFFQYDLTAEQYAALTKLTAALCAIFPNLPCDTPRTPDGNLRTDTLSPDELKAFSGVLGHYHIQTNKIDPGPAMQWERVIEGARELLNRQKKAETKAP